MSGEISCGIGIWDRIEKWDGVEKSDSREEMKRTGTGWTETWKTDYIKKFKGLQQEHTYFYHDNQNMSYQGEDAHISCQFVC